MQQDDDKVKELLAVLEQKTDKKSKDQTDIYAFFQYYNFAPGKHKILTHALYVLYKRWSSKPTTFRNFSCKAAYYLDRASRIRFFINKEPLEYILPLIIKKNKNLASPSSVKKINKFLQEKGWTKGPYYHDATTLYYHLSEWSKSKRRRPPSSAVFFMILGLKFPNRKEGILSKYGINKEVHISQQKLRAFKKLKNVKKQKTRE